MIPDHKLSETPMPSDLVVPIRQSAMEDYEYLPQASADAPSRLVRVFYSYDEQAIMMNDTGTITKILAVSNINRLGYTRDQNGRHAVTYVSNGETFLYWYDTSIGQMTTTSWGTSVVDPCVSFDDTRFVFLGSGDVIFSYVRDGSLYFREQRSRYQIEYHLQDNIRNLWQTGMGTNNRFQWATY